MISFLKVICDNQDSIFPIKDLYGVIWLLYAPCPYQGEQSVTYSKETVYWKCPLCHKNNEGPIYDELGQNIYE